ncbi:MAG: FHA domain-containing protein [Rhodothermales bacterium]
MPPLIRVQVEQGDAPAAAFSFTESFRIGRGGQCEVQVDSGLVSRVHAEVVFDDGAWWVRDLGSTNGLYLNGERTPQIRLETPTAVQLGRNAPILHFSVEPAGSRTEEEQVAAMPPKRTHAASQAETVRAGEPPSPPTISGDAASAMSGASSAVTSDTPSTAPQKTDPPSTDASTPKRAHYEPKPSLDHIIERYFEEDSDGGSVGDRTRMIRHAYKTVQKKQKRKYTWLVVAMVVVVVVAVGFGVFQKIENNRLRQQAADFFLQIRQQDVDIAELRIAVEETGNASLVTQLARREQQRQRLMDDYEGYVQELGFYRKLRTEEERLIYQTARIFNESEFGVKASFIREVNDMIRDYWQTGGGQRRFEQAVRRAEEEGYTPFIVRTLREQGLPPEFFYLALQESDFIPDRIGVPTRWGRAKGMWQFIPATARRYGLDPGPLENTGAVDAGDDRQNWRLATEAAARYLRDIHGTLAQASGLLVMASYNWGEHRVNPRLGTIEAETPQEAFAATFQDVPRDPDARNYWRFLEEYEERIPEETKDYVLKIFSAAVIGQNPRHFGFDYDNPLAPYMEAADDGN